MASLDSNIPKTRSISPSLQQPERLSIITFVLALLFWKNFQNWTTERMLLMTVGIVKASAPRPYCRCLVSMISRSATHCQRTSTCKLFQATPKCLRLCPFSSCALEMPCKNWSRSKSSELDAPSSALESDKRWLFVLNSRRSSWYSFLASIDQGMVDEYNVKWEKEGLFFYLQCSLDLLLIHQMCRSGQNFLYWHWHLHRWYCCLSVHNSADLSNEHLLLARCTKQSFSLPFVELMITKGKSEDEEKIRKNFIPWYLYMFGSLIYPSI